MQAIVMPEKLTNEELTELALRARTDSDALNELIAYEIEYVTWWVHNNVYSYQNDLDDIIQEILIAISDGIPRFRGDSSFFWWSECLMHKRLFDWFRRANRLKRSMESLYANMEEIGGSYEMVDRLESEEAFSELLDMVSDDDRDFLTLLFVDGYKVVDIHRMRYNHIHYEALRSKMRRAMGTIKHELERRAEKSS